MTEREQIVTYIREMADMARTNPEKLPHPPSALFMVASLEALATQIEKGAHVLPPAEQFAAEIMPLLKRIIELGVPIHERELLREPTMQCLGDTFDPAAAHRLRTMVEGLVAKYERSA